MYELVISSKISAKSHSGNEIELAKLRKSVINRINLFKSGSSQTRKDTGPAYVRVSVVSHSVVVADAESGTHAGAERHNAVSAGRDARRSPSTLHRRPGDRDSGGSRRPRLHRGDNCAVLLPL